MSDTTMISPSVDERFALVTAQLRRETKTRLDSEKTAAKHAKQFSRKAWVLMLIVYIEVIFLLTHTHCLTNA
jgi:hypothetical protein